MSLEKEACCKVGSTIAAFKLDGFLESETGQHGELIDRWTGTDDRQGMGYRPLTDWFNKQVIQQAYLSHGIEPSPERITRDYAVLQGDDDLQQEALKDRLRSEGVKPSELEQSLVSWSTMGRHLTDCLGATKPEITAETDWEKNSVKIAESILTDKLETALTSLTAKDRIADGNDAQIVVDIQLRCGTCPRKAPFDTVLSRGYVCPEHH